MMRCIYCGRFAGLFSRSHKTCECLHSSGLARLHGLFRKYFRGEASADVLACEFYEIKADGFLTDEDVGKCVDYALKAFADSLYSPVDSVCLDRLAAFLEQEDCLETEEAGLYVAQKLAQAYMEEWTEGVGGIAGVECRISAALGVLSVDERSKVPVLQKALVGVAESLERKGYATEEVRERFSGLCHYVGMKPQDVWRSGNDALKTVCKLIVVDEFGLKRPDSDKVLWLYDGVKAFVPRLEWTEKGYPALPGLRYGPEQFKRRRPDYEKFCLNGCGRLYVFSDRLRFESETWSFEICFDSISGVEPYSDAALVEWNSGVVLLRGTDAWFLMSLFNLA